MKLDEICRDVNTAVAVAYGSNLRPWRDLPPHIQTMVREGVAAVLRKHIEPMIAEAYSHGWNGSSLYRSKEGAAGADIDYARRIITAIVEK